MPIVFAAIAAAGALASTGAGIAGAAARKSANEQAADLTRQQAQMTRDQTVEEYRRSQLRNEQLIGDVRSRVAASGFASSYAGSSSMSAYAKTFSSELDRESLWMRSQGFRKADLQEQAADVQQAGGQAQFFGDVLGATGSGISQMGSIVNNVLKTPSAVASTPTLGAPP